MISLVMIMVHILFEDIPEGAFTDQDQPRQGFVLY